MYFSVFGHLHFTIKVYYRNYNNLLHLNFYVIYTVVGVNFLFTWSHAGVRFVTGLHHWVINLSLSLSLSLSNICVTLNLNTGLYKPYMTPNNNILHIHNSGYNPPRILKNIPVAANNRLSSISATEETFNKIASTYQEALKKSNDNYKFWLDTTQTTEQTPKKKQKKTIWFIH